MCIRDRYMHVSPKRCKIGGKLVPVLIINRKSYMSFRLVPKSVTLNDLKRGNGPYFAVIFKKFSNFRGVLCKSRWQSHNYGQFTITMSSTGLAIVLIRSHIWAFDWYKYRWPWMTLNGEMALILHWVRSFSRDGITPVWHEMTWTSLISSGVKERREQFWSVYINVARCTWR